MGNPKPKVSKTETEIPIMVEFDGKPLVKIIRKVEVDC
jgi:hypothetical protein